MSAMHMYWWIDTDVSNVGTDTEKELVLGAPLIPSMNN